MNRWKKLIARLKARSTNPYTGTESDLTTVKAYLIAENIELDDFDVDAEHAAFTTAATRKTLLDIDDGTETTDADDEGDGDEDDAIVQVPMRKSELENVKAAMKARATSHKAGRDMAGSIEETNRNRGTSSRAVEAAKKSYDHRAKMGKTALPSADQAELFGAWFRANSAKQMRQYWHCSQYEKQRDADLAILKAGSIGTDSLGGATVPLEFIPDLIRLVEEYGVVRGLTGTTPMSGDKATFPRQIGGLTAYYVAENGTITASDTTFNNVTLSAKKLSVLSLQSMELLHDSAINIADLVARNAALAIAQKEDQSALIGDGSSTYGGILGLDYTYRKVVTDGGGTWATNAGNAAGVVVAAGNTVDEVTLDDLEKMVGTLPQYAASGAKWLMSRWAFARIAEKLALTPATGGVSYEMVNGIRVPQILGYPVQISQVMPRSDANSQFLAYLGNFALGGKIGEVTGSQIMAVSDQRYFELDQWAFKYGLRHDIQWHDVGDYNATAASRTPGPIMGLLSAAS